MSHRPMWVRIRNTLRGRSRRAAPIAGTPASASWVPPPLMHAACVVPGRSSPPPGEPFESANIELAAVLLALPVALGFMLTGDAVLGVLLAALAWLPVLLCCAGPVREWCRARPQAQPREGMPVPAWPDIIALDAPLAGDNMPAIEAAAPRAGASKACRPSPVVIATVRRSGEDRVLWASIVYCPIPARDATPLRSLPAAAGSEATRLRAAEAIY